MRVTIQIIARANMVSAVNAWLRNNLGATGDNLTVELIGINDPDDAPVSHYACNWGQFERTHAGQFRNGVVNSPNVSLFVNVDFWAAIESMGLRVKPVPFP